LSLRKRSKFLKAINTSRQEFGVRQTKIRGNEPFNRSMWQF
jgi:hypothetical protein